MFARSVAAIGFCLLLGTAYAQNLQDLIVPLDETGIAEWSFLNPKTPRALGTDQSLVFTNETANRTFVVTIPFEFRTEELGTAYTTSAITAPESANERLTMPVYVGRVVPLTAQETRTLRELEYLQLLREDVSTLKGEPADLADLGAVGPREVLTLNHLDALYWTAACRSPDEEDRLGTGEDDPPGLRQNLEGEAESLMKRLLGDSPLTDPGCVMLEARKVRDRVVNDRFGPPVKDPFLERARTTALKRFVSSRIGIARAALLNAIKLRIASSYTAAEPVLRKLNVRRDQLLLEPAGDVRTCRMNVLRAAATLLATYGPGGQVPFSSPLLAQDPDQVCLAYGKLPRDRSDADNRMLAQLEAVERGELGNVGFEITDCTGDGKTTCVARATIPPKQRAAFSRSILERRTDRRVQFLVAFFDEAEPPSNATGYTFLSSFTRLRIAEQQDELKETLPSQTPASLAFNFAGDAGIDYALPKGMVESHIRRTSGAASLGFQYVGPYDLSATLQFKKGDLASASNPVQATQYQAKIFGPIGTVLEYGKFVFARPSSAIALSEFGEGLRFSFRRANLGYMVRRQSDNPRKTTGQGNEDSYVLIGQYNPSISFLRSLLLTATWGNDKGAAPPEKNPDCVTFKADAPATPLDPCSVPHTYGTAGFDVKFPIGTSRNISGSLAAYHSIRNMRKFSPLDVPANPPPAPQPNFAPTTDGKGDVALLTVAWSRLVEQSLLKPLEQAKPSFSMTGFLGYGSADDPDSARDESYLGETAGFANDKLFLSNIAETKKVLGHGLANKWYAGFQYTNARWSPLKYIAQGLGALSEVQSMTTIVTAHKYQFIRDLRCPTFPEDAVCTANAAALPGARNAGYEIDVDFLIETPKNVRWSLSGGWYRTSRVVEAVGVKKNPWIVLANVSLKFNAR